MRQDRSARTDAPFLTATTLDGQLRQAIAAKCLIEIEYKNTTRTVEPHDYGAQKSVDRLLAYQRRTLGGRKTNDRGWRLLDVPKITRCRVLDDRFTDHVATLTFVTMRGTWCMPASSSARRESANSH